MANVEYCRDIRELCRHLRERQPSPTLYAVPAYVSATDAAKTRRVFTADTMCGGSSIYASSAPPLYEYRDGSTHLLDTYLADAEAIWQQHAAALGGPGHPFARLMDDLAKGLDEPVRRLVLRGKQCFFGQFRCFAGEDIEPHVDTIEQEFPDLVPRPGFQWAVNLTLEQPRSGGELSVWNRVPSPEEYRGYGLERPQSEPAVRFQPHVGDLYVFPSRFVHAVAPSEGLRCAMAGFLGGWADQGIRVWS